MEEDTRGTSIQLGLARSLRFAFQALKRRDGVEVNAEQSLEMIMDV